jgi:hypothetical protein
MADEAARKKVDESWKDRVDQEKQVAPGQPPAAQLEAKPAAQGEALPEARFDLFLSGLAMDAWIALGEMPHPSTRKSAMSLPHARYLIDLLGVFEEKTRGNLTADEERLLKDTLYQLRMRYLAKAG